MGKKKGFGIPAPLPFKILQFSPIFIRMKDTWHIKYQTVKDMPHQNIIFTHRFHSATSIHKPTSHIHQQSLRTEGKEPSEWCRRCHPLTPMTTNSNATMVLGLLYFYFLFSQKKMVTLLGPTIVGTFFYVALRRRGEEAV